MKLTILLTFFIVSSIASVDAQRPAHHTIAYAITAPEKGSSAWAEVRLIDVTTGEQIKTIYGSNDQVQILNARTGKQVLRKDLNNSLLPAKKEIVIQNIDNSSSGIKALPAKSINNNPVVMDRPLYRYKPVPTDKPFATNSAACAYDKKHDRLYYTPMGINQLRYIDLKSNASSIYYFEDEAFGVVSGPWDVRNQITRMVIAADGNGYALTNNGDHLIRFTTNKKIEIKDLGSLTDDPANENFSIHGSNAFGGDMVADDLGDLVLITAGGSVYKIDVRSKIATYKGNITGLPKGYSTNGAIVQERTTIVVSSASSTDGYYKFDLKTMKAEKLPVEGPVFNASDLANGNVVSESNRPEEAVAIIQNVNDLLKQNAFSVYPNPVTIGSPVKLSFANQPQGKYIVQFMDLSGKIIDLRQVSLSNRMQVEEYKLPKAMAKGNYLVKVVSESQKVVGVNTIVVQ